MSAPPGASHLRRLAGSFFGAGMLPAIPGTWGSLATVLVFMALVGTAGLEGVLGEGLLSRLLPGDAAGELWTGPAHDGSLSPRAVGVLWGVGVIVVITLLGVVVGNRAREDWGRGDPGPFVLDEVAGQLIPLLVLLPGPVDPLGLVVAFAAFRAFDILKPPPIRQLERLHGGVGIMADDLAAGLLALIPVAFLV